MGYMADFMWFFLVYMLVGLFSLLTPPFRKVVLREDTVTAALQAQGKVTWRTRAAFKLTVVILVSLIWPILVIHHLLTE